jgi:hypothetical protein
MSDIGESDLARTRIGATFTIRPVGHIVGDVAGLFGESLQTLLGMFYPSPVCKKANVVITEFVQNVVENVSDGASGMQLDVRIDEHTLTVSCTNKVTAAQADAVRSRIDLINSTPDVRRLLAQTIRARRVDRLKGGLGLMRLVSENKFRLSADYSDDLLTVRAEFRMKGAA